MEPVNENRPYELFSREIKARIGRRGLKLKSVAQKTGTNESVIKAACAGTRPLGPGVLRKLSALLAGMNEDENTLFDLLCKVCNSGASRTYFARGLVAPIRVGYVDSFPFAFPRQGNPNTPRGLLVEILEIFFQVLHVRYEWHPVPYNRLIDALETHEVDLVTGFILESPQRRVRAYFSPLPMPFCLGINAVSSSPLLSPNLTYSKFCDSIDKAAHDGQPFTLITVADEIADDYLPLIITHSKTTRETQRNVAEAIKYYTSEHPERNKNIIFADQMTCQSNHTSDAQVLFKDSIGAFRGGLVLPVYDLEWAEFIEKGLLSFLSARMPRIGGIFSEYHTHLAPFILRDSPDEGNVMKYSNLLTKSWPIREWISTFWPPQIPIPISLLPDISELLREESKPTYSERQN